MKKKLTEQNKAIYQISNHQTYEVISLIEEGVSTIKVVSNKAHHLHQVKLLQHLHPHFLFD